MVLFQEQQQEEPWWPSQRALDHYSAELGGDNVVVADLIATGSDVLAVVDYVLVDKVRCNYNVRTIYIDFSVSN